jgi:hypothetical protein
MVGRVVAGNAAEKGRHMGAFIGQIGDQTRVAQPRRKKREALPPWLVFHRRPEFAKAVEALLRRIAGDDASIDGAARDADDPVRLDPGFVERLVNPAW